MHLKIDQAIIHKLGDESIQKTFVFVCKNEIEVQRKKKRYHILTMLYAVF